MTQKVEPPQANIPLVREDRHPTQETQVMLEKLVLAVKDLQDRVAALEAFHP